MLIDAADEHRRADEQHERECHFGDHEHGAQAVARAAATGAAAPSFSVADEIGARGLKGRREPEEQTRHGRDDGRVQP